MITNSFRKRDQKKTKEMGREKEEGGMGKPLEKCKTSKTLFALFRYTLARWEIVLDIIILYILHQV